MMLLVLLSCGGPEGPDGPGAPGGDLNGPRGPGELGAPPPGAAPPPGGPPRPGGGPPPPPGGGPGTPDMPGMSAQRGAPGSDGPAQKIAPGSSFLSWGWAPEPLTRLQDVETGALRGTRMGVVIPAAGKLWEVHSSFSSIRCTCDAAPACTGQKGELHPLPTGTDEPLLPPTPGEWAELEQRTQLLGSVGPFLMATAERRGTTCTGEARQELHFAVTDLRSRKEVVLHDPGEESLVTMGPKSWAIRELLLDPEVPEAGTAKLAWVRPGWEGDELRVYYRYYAPSVEGKGDGIVAFNTRSVERSSGAPPRLLHPYAQRPSAISGLWDKDRPGGWAVAEPGVVPKGLFRSEP